MKRQIGNIAFGVAIVFSTFAVPGYSATVISITGTTTGGAVTTDNANVVVTGISNVPYDTLSVGLDSYAITSGFLSLSGSVLTLDGEISGIGIDASIPLVTITLSSSLTNAGGATDLNVNFPFTTDVTVSTTLLDDLGITGSVTTDLIGGDLNGSGSNQLYEPVSETMAIYVTSAAAPEPGSLPLLGIGLLGIALFLRKRLLHLQ